MHRIDIVHVSALPLSELFCALADHENLSQVFGVPVRRIHDGLGEPNAVGSVRRIGPQPLGVEETVTALETDRSIDYRITRGGFPLRNHRGRLEFSATDRGSQVRWTIEFNSWLPITGTLLRMALGHAIGRGLKRIG
jgi:hypothetical protein